jgi:VWA domain containing CoxE-like protein
MTELDVRTQVLNSFLTTPHGKLDVLAPLHTSALARDPLFYGHLAAWYAERGEVRDHKVLFVAHLLTSDYPELREAGWVLLQKLPPHMVAAAVDHAKRVIGKLPRIFKGAVAGYLRGLELDVSRFDRAALRGKQTMKHLYATLRIAPGPRAQRVLFADDPPVESPLFALKALARSEDPAEQARIIVERRIPYTTAVGALKAITPSALVALIEVMSPQEAINHLASLKKRGAFDSPEVKALVEAKLKAAETDKRVSTLKATRALASVALDDETAELLTAVTDARVARMARITRPTALFVDKSSSMTQAIEVAKEVAALVSAVSDSFEVLAFDSEVFEIRAKGAERSAWEQAFRMVKADGNTSIGAPLAKLAQERRYVEQVVIITDMEENTAPLFTDAYAQYVREVGVGPQVVIVAVGGRDRRFPTQLQAHGIPLAVWEFGGDYYSLPHVVQLLSAPSRAELVAQVMAVPLPARAA